ncbi:MAG TPA: phage integrase N-terminal SAM-like domain-containing protein, partial [Ginsengibacter sp.]|nr:phage integrase N-terminal SAM-like domain-containing protein [Ginsengibacter sp.]
MEKIVLKPLQHRGNLCIGIYFRKNQTLQSVLQKDTGARWSRTHTCWYVAFNQKNYVTLVGVLSGKALIEQSEDLKKLISTGGITPELPGRKEKEERKTNSKIRYGISIPSGIIYEVNLGALQQFERELILKGYSKSTIRTYLNEFRQFLVAIKNHPAEEFTPDRLKDYLQYCSEKLHLGENTLHSRMNALKFYYEKVLGREKFFWVIPRPKKKQQLPKVFSQNEIAAIINSVKNKKHKVMLMLAYSGGLRVSEVINLKTYQVDSSRMTIFISQSKGKKDRVVTLSPVLLVMLREYAMEYKPDKKGYLFEGNKKGTP